MRNELITSCFLVVAAAVYPGTAQALTFTDWQTINTTTNVAVGQIGAVSVTFTGQDIDIGVTNGSYAGFNSPLFTPSLVNSDMVGFRGAPSGYLYNLSFESPILDPVLHFSSLASTLSFSTSNITRLSGDGAFTVSGNLLIGSQNDNPNGYDTNGTIRLNGLYSNVQFSATYPSFAGDGIFFQVGALPVPEPTTSALMFCGLIVCGVRLYARRV